MVPWPSAAQNVVTRRFAYHVYFVYILMLLALFQFVRQISKYSEEEEVVVECFMMKGEIDR